MRIVFLGTPLWAVPSLEFLGRSSLRPTLVVTQPSKRRARGAEASPSPVAEASARLEIPTIDPDSVRDPAILVRLREEAADFFVVVAYGKILPKAMLEVPRLGCVNLHFSLLPRWRGAAPVQWAIAEGDVETGVTTIGLVEALDAGPIYLQERAPIAPDEHAPALGARLATLGAPLLAATLEGIAAGTLSSRVQDRAHATTARLLRPEDGWIDWSASADVIARRVRGFDPWPGQSSLCRTGRIRILEARSLGARQGAPAGTVLGEAGRACRIACGDGSVLEALSVRPEGRREITGAEAVRGRHLSAGESLGTGPPTPTGE